MSEVLDVLRVSLSQLVKDGYVATSSTREGCLSDLWVQVVKSVLGNTSEYWHEQYKWYADQKWNAKAEVARLHWVLESTVEVDPDTQRWKLSEKKFYSMYGETVEKRSGGASGVPMDLHAHHNAQQLMQMITARDGKQRVLDVLKEQSMVVSSITTTVKVGEAGAARVQTREQPVLVAPLNKGVFDVTSNLKLLSKFQEAARTTAYTNGLPGDWYQRFAQVNRKITLPNDVKAEFMAVMEETPLVTERGMREYLATKGARGFGSGDAKAAVADLLSVPFNFNADPGPPTVLASTTSKASRWLYQTQQVTESFNELSTALDGMVADTCDVYKYTYNTRIDRDRTLSTVIAKPKYDVYPASWEDVDVVARKGNTVSGKVPTLAAGKVRMYYAQSGYSRGMYWPGARYLEQAAETYGNRVRMEWVGDAYEYTLLSKRLPWCALGFTHVRGGTNFLHGQMEKESREHGYSLCMYGDDSIVYVKVLDTVIALGGDASRFDLSQPQGCKEVVEEAFTVGLNKGGASGIIKGSLQLLLAGLFDVPRPALLFGNVATVVEGGVASGGRSLTESNSVVAYCCMRWIMDRVMPVLEGLGEDVRGNEVEALSYTFVKYADELHSLTGMKFGIEAVSTIAPLPNLAANSIGGLVHAVPFLGYEYRYASDASGVVSVIGTLATDRADKKIIYGRNEDGNEAMLNDASQVASYYLARGYVDDARSQMAMTLFKNLAGRDGVAEVVLDGLPVDSMAPSKGHVRRLWPRGMVLQFMLGKLRSLYFPRTEREYTQFVLNGRDVMDTETIVRGTEAKQYEQQVPVVATRQPSGYPTGTTVVGPTAGQRSVQPTTQRNRITAVASTNLVQPGYSKSTSYVLKDVVTAYKEHKVDKGLTDKAVVGLVMGLASLPAVAEHFSPAIRKMMETRRFYYDSSTKKTYYVTIFGMATAVKAYVVALNTITAMANIVDNSMVEEVLDSSNIYPTLSDVPLKADRPQIVYVNNVLDVTAPEGMYYLVALWPGTDTRLFELAVAQGVTTSRQPVGLLMSTVAHDGKAAPLPRRQGFGKMTKHGLGLVMTKREKKHAKSKRTEEDEYDYDYDDGYDDIHPDIHSVSAYSSDSDW